MKRFNSSKWITKNKHGKNLTEGMSPEEWADAKEKERLNQHPEKDTINKIKKMMDKEKPQTEDYKPSHRAYNVIDKSNNDKIVAKELSRDKALELAKTNKDYMIDATDRLAETRPDYTPPPMGMGGEEKEDEEQDEYDKGWYGESLRETATQLGYLKEHYKGYKTDNTLNPWNRPEFNQDENNAYRYFNDLFFDGNFENPNELLRDLEEFHMIEKEEAKRILSQYFNDLMKTVEKEVTDTTEKQTFKNSMIKKGFKGYLNEVDGMEGGIDLNAMQYQKVTFVYTEQGGRFYGLDVYVSKDQPQRSDKLRYDEANEWLKDTLSYIHEDDLIPRKYISGLEDLDLIVDRLKELEIEASHNDFMDVS